MDQKGREIAYQVAYKAAVELVTSKVVTLDADDIQDIGGALVRLTDQVFDPFVANLMTVGGPSGPSPTLQPRQPSGNTPSATPQYQNPTADLNSWPEGSSDGSNISFKQKNFLRSLLNERSGQHWPQNIDGLGMGEAKQWITNLLSIPKDE
jgi:hypothetical protein